MRRFSSALVLLLAMTVSAQAHFVFILPVEKSRKAQVVFSDTLKPDRPELLKKVAGTRFSARVDGKDVAVKATTGKDTLDITVSGEGPAWVVGVCDYGVSTRGKEPVLLTYYCKSIVGSDLPHDAEFLEQKFPSLKLDLVPLPGAKDGPAVKVLWEGKPLADAEVVLYVPGIDKTVERKTDADGMVKVEKPTKNGLYGVRASHTVKKSGKLGDQEYAVQRSYCSLTARISSVKEPEEKTAKKPAAEQSFFVTALLADKPDANPEATKLLADAREARANWVDFPGFTAKVAVNVEGKVHTGTVEVNDKGKVNLTIDGDDKGWAKSMLASIVGHRMDDGTTLTTPCAFADDVTDHPLGRSIRVLNDEFHSSYRIRDRQVIEVNRSMKDVRFTITVMQNRLNAEKKYLPAHYVVNYWDAKSGALKKSVTHYNTWKRVGKFDLPVTAMVLTAEDGKQVTRTITLSEHSLNK
jgi:uncharacterized GH25 family protein